VENLLYLFNQFTPDEKQDIKIIRSYINTFYSIIIKYVNLYDILDELLLNLPMYMLRLYNTIQKYVII